MKEAILFYTLRGIKTAPPSIYILIFVLLLYKFSPLLMILNILKYSPLVNGI
jgi:hypothetical protein